ncbi:MAG: ABC transporter ATP-binding protein [Lentisphaerae bacterium]|nr:ABC transporter ATP-binding protein [Lentisphaerota bacterium]
MSEFVIEAEQVCKEYRVFGSVTPTLMNALSRYHRKNARVIKALDDVSFRIRKGETVGVIGPNGSGKSSLLGLVCGTLSPTRGRVRTVGVLAPLLELGAGFHSELTGRENIFLNGAILGIPKETIRRRFDHIVEFSGLRDFIDMPVKHYSSGMYIRLGFSVAAEMDPDILLIDEVLAVGDVTFQLKCLERIRDFQKRGRTLMIVSHSLQVIEEFCGRALLLHRGKLVAEGDPSEVVFTYLKNYMNDSNEIRTTEYGTQEAVIEGVTFRDEKNLPADTFHTGRPLHIDIAYLATKRIEKPVFGFSVKTANGVYIFGSNTQIAQFPLDAIEGRGVLRLTIAPLTLMHGNFFLSLSIHSWDHLIQYHRRDDWYPFGVKNPTSALGLFQLDTRWSRPES